MRRFFSSFTCLLIVVITTFSSCRTTNSSIGGANCSLDALSFMQGDWRSKGESVVVEESWSLCGDSLLRGAGSMRMGADTIYNEELGIYCQGEGIYLSSRNLSADVPGQLTYRLVKSSKGKAIFVNKSIVLQSRITYQLKGDREIELMLEGEEEGEASREVYRLYRQ